MKIQDKKAITRKTLIELIVIILSAVIIIIFFGELSPIYGGEINKDACFNSVLTRAAIIEGGGVLGEIKSLPALQCKTEKYCLNLNEKCSAGYTSVKVKDDKEIKEEIANYMYDCWSMMGEGKRIFKKPIFIAPNECVICSIISFSDDISMKYLQINNLGAHLDEKVIPEKNMTYSEYISLGDIPSIETNKKYAILLKQKVGKTVVTESNLDIVPYNTKELEELSCKDFKSIP